MPQVSLLSYADTTDEIAGLEATESLRACLHARVK
jgi:hypothetical protein